MYPFTTDRNEGLSKLPTQEFKRRIQQQILSETMYQPDGKFYGVVNQYSAKFILGKKPIKDLDVVVILKWKPTNEGVLVTSYLRPDNSLNYMILTCLTLGVYLVIQDNNLAALLPILAISMLSYLFAYHRYKTNKSKTLEQLDLLFQTLELIRIQSIANTLTKHPLNAP